MRGETEETINVGNVTGAGIAIGRNAKASVRGSVNINTNALAEMPSEYAKSLQEFTNRLNDQIKKQNISQEQAKPVQDSLDELVKEVQGTKPNEALSYVKKTNVESKLANVIQNVTNLLPKAAETISLFTPLAPLSKLIGKGVDSIVKAIAK